MPKILIRITLLALTFLPLAAYPIAFEATEEARAFKRGDLKTVKRLVEKEDYFRDDPELAVEALHFAVDSGNLELIKYLASRGWLEHCRKVAFCAPIHVAARYQLKKSKPMIEYFLSQGFSPLVITPGGDTPLHFAIQSSHVEAEVVRYLCRLGVDETLRDQYSKETPLEHAMYQLNTRQLSTDPKEDARIRAQLREVVSYLESGQCRKDGNK